MLTPSLTPAGADLLLEHPAPQPRARRPREKGATPSASLDEITGGGPILVLAPHPDDDVLGCGGLIAACAAAGAPAHVAYLTDGRRSHLGAPDWPADRLSAARRKEAIDAAKLLGLAPEALTFAPNRDGALLFDARARRRTRNALSELISGHRVARVFATWIRDPHPDHVATALLARALCREHPRTTLMSYPIWAQLAPARLERRARPWRTLRLDVGAHLKTKRDALAAHKTQTTGLIGNALVTLHPSERQREAFLTGSELFLAQA
jgi:LmbE family N-acetylglucosaminyl deacetylase